jgi:hypothetical protein
VSRWFGGGKPAADVRAGDKITLPDGTKAKVTKVRDTADGEKRISYDAGKGDHGQTILSPDDRV